MTHSYITKEIIDSLGGIDFLHNKCKATNVTGTSNCLRFTQEQNGITKFREINFAQRYPIPMFTIATNMSQGEKSHIYERVMTAEQMKKFFEVE
jgi:hypothetical protein